MDAQWFKKRQKQIGVTADEIAAVIGRDRSNVSKIYNGQQSMTLPWARAFAQALDLSLDQVLEHAGAVDAMEAVQIKPGFSESDATPFTGAPTSARDKALGADLGAGKAGVDIWDVRSDALLLRGLMPGDRILVDANRAERAKADDIVLAQVYDMRTGSALTVLREYQPPVLLAASGSHKAPKVYVVDGNNVVIRGVVTASWREMA